MLDSGAPLFGALYGSSAPVKVVQIELGASRGVSLLWLHLDSARRAWDVAG